MYSSYPPVTVPEQPSDSLYTPSSTSSTRRISPPRFSSRSPTPSSHHTRHSSHDEKQLHSQSHSHGSYRYSYGDYPRDCQSTPHSDPHHNHHSHSHGRADDFPSAFTFPLRNGTSSNGYAPSPAGPHGNEGHLGSLSQSNEHQHSHLSNHLHSQKCHDNSVLYTSPKSVPLSLSTITGPLLVSITYLAIEYTSKHHHTTQSFQVDSPHERSVTTSANLLSAFSLVSGILLLSSLYSQFKFVQQRGNNGGQADHTMLSNKDQSSGKYFPAKHNERVTITKVVELGFTLLLPILGALELGGAKAALFCLAALAGGVTGAFRSSGGWRKLLVSHRGIAVVLITWIAWEATVAVEGEFHAVMIAYIALLSSTLFLEFPFTSLAAAVTAQEHGRRSKLAAATGLVMSLPPLFNWLFITTLLGSNPRWPVEARISSFWWWVASVIVCWMGLTFANVAKRGVIGYYGFVMSTAIGILGDLLLNAGEKSLWAMMNKFVFAGAAIGAIYFDKASVRDHSHHWHQHDEGHCQSHVHSHENSPVSSKSKPPSQVTRLLISASRPIPLLHSILVDRNSRRIFYFMLLNFTFMLIQTVYGLLTSSLGLLSDSIHMLFDCLALLLGLFAAVMSKYPPSARFPYGLGKMDSLAGFANGVFLMLISIEIVLEAIERLVEPVEVKRIGELLAVSSLGLLVNLVGIYAFDHAHHHPGHEHGHSHSHSHSHSHDGEGDGAHGHSENMHGIFLHILADTLGSVAVVISTLLVQHFNWSGFDPLASVFIAIMIFISAVPLVLSSAGGLLLTVPSNTEYSLREILAGINELRGVVGCCVPRFWVNTVEGEEGEQQEEGNERSGDHAHGTECNGRGRKMILVGVIHVQVAQEVGDLGGVRARVEKYLAEGLGKGGVGVDVLVQVEKVGEQGPGYCWCGGGVGDIPGVGDTGTSKGHISAASGVGLQPVGLGLYVPSPGPDDERVPPTERARDKTK